MNSILKSICLSWIPFIVPGAIAQGNGCDLTLSNPTIAYQSAEYQQDFIQTLRNKGYTIYRNTGGPGDFRTRFLLHFTDSGVIRLGTTATMQLIIRDHARRYRVVFEDSRRTFGRDEDMYFRKLLENLPSCRGGTLY